MEAKSSPPPASFGMRSHKSCDACKARKVRCPNAGYPGPCGNCIRRNTACHFGTKKVPKRNVTKHLLLNKPPASPETPESLKKVKLSNSSVSDYGGLRPYRPDDGAEHSDFDHVPKLYVDYLLAQAQRQTTSRSSKEDTSPPVRGNGIFGGSYSLTFFSESRLMSLSTRLQNNKVNELVRRINVVIGGRVRRTEPATQEPILQPNRVADFCLDRDFASNCIKLYFDRSHSLYAFLDRGSFEAKALSPELPRSLSRSKAWCSLYHAVLAIGCLYADGGSFEPGKGEAWRLFSIALSNFSELLTLPDSLITLQALTAMAIYGLCVSCLSIERIILSEASRRAQNLASTNLVGQAAHSYQKTFWVLYGIEKVMSFHFGRSSAFVDSDICCPIPSVPESVFGDVDWFLILIRHARLLSRTYTSLLSVGASCNSTAYCLAIIDQLRAEVEDWRLSIPSTGGIRPGTRFQNHIYSSASESTMALATSFLYHSFVLILSRAKVHHLAKLDSPSAAAQHAATEKGILESARAILELTTFINVEPYTPLWILAVIPLTALFVLFDIVVHDPSSPDTPSNLALLDIGGGYFSRIEYASGNTLPGSLISEFAHIARDYVNDFQRRRPESAEQGPPPPASSPVLPLLSPKPTPAPNESLALSTLERTPDWAQATMGVTNFRDPVLPNSISPGFRDEFSYVYSGDLPGTDVMGLFSYFLPEMDSFLYQSLGDELDTN